MPQSKSLGITGSLQALAEAHFPRERGFTAAERKLLAMAPTGEVAICGPSQAMDPSKAERKAGNTGWGREREIGADLIRWLCVDHRAKERVDPSGIKVGGAKITGKLDLDFAIVPFPLRLGHCALTQDAFLRQVEIPQIDLYGTWAKSIYADGAIVKGSVLLSNKFHADGEVSWLGAHIGGDLDCHGGNLSNPGGYALLADRVEVRGAVFLQDKFAAQGEVNLLGAQVGGT